MKGKIFNAQELQAILNGSKVMFREVLKPQPLEQLKPFKDLGYWTNNFEIGEWGCPYQVGQKIFCKEAWLNHSGDFFSTTYYPASMTEEELFAARHVIRRRPQYMKQEHSRLTLLIKEIKVERLGDISEEDAIAEGVSRLFPKKDSSWTNYLWHGRVQTGRITQKQSDEWYYQYSGYECAKDSFSSLWNATHKKPEEKFEASPFCWVISFEVINN